jgi:DNA processing protein
MALWVRGNLAAIEQLENSVAIVGCRGSSSYGEYATQNMVESLVNKDITVISGGAYGIDGVAHRSTLAMKGNTVAVMAGGVDRFYPTGHADLLKRISQTGAVISELPPGAIPSKWRFLQRNRLIAALSQATLVVEANWRSGSLNTVSHAERLERPVFAVPGPITSPKSAGTNKLIADGRAGLVVDGQDFLERLGVQSRPISQTTLAGLGAIETRVLDALGFNALILSEICSEAGLTRDEAKFGLGILEIEGLVLRRDNAWTRSQTTV